MTTKTSTTTEEPAPYRADSDKPEDIDKAQAVDNASTPEPMKMPKADHKVKTPAEPGEAETHTIETSIGTVVIRHAIADRGDLEVVSAEVHDPATGQVNDVVLLKVAQ